jgi:hypothetical protein
VTPRQLCQSGTAEPLKLAIHCGMLAGAVACCAYNAAAWAYRRETHNAVNAIVYGMLCCLEWAHVRHHAERVDIGH